MTASTGTPPVGDIIRDHLIVTKKIPAETRRRLLDYDEIGIRKSQREEYEVDGWVFERELKTKLKMRRLKAHDLAFEDRVWAALARLQFTHMNAARSFTLRYGEAENEAQQIDVFAADDEVVLVVECKSTATVGRAGQFKTEIEALQGKREGLMRRIREEYPQHKIKFIFATNNYTLSDEVKLRIAAANVFHIDEYTVEYYLELAGHLGPAAKYQVARRALRWRQDPQHRFEAPGNPRVDGRLHVLLVRDRAGAVPKDVLRVAPQPSQRGVDADLPADHQEIASEKGRGVRR